MKLVQIGLCVSLLAGCSTLPSAEKVDAFGGATAASSTLLQNAAVANRTLALRIGEEDQAARYIRGGVFSLSDKPDAMLDPENFKPRLEALRALEDYGKALKLAADPGRHRSAGAGIGQSRHCRRRPGGRGIAGRRTGCGAGLEIGVAGRGVSARQCLCG
jgi:hypothetical protein